MSPHARGLVAALAVSAVAHLGAGVLLARAWRPAAPREPQIEESMHAPATTHPNLVPWPAEASPPSTRALAQAWRAWWTTRFRAPGDVRIAIDAGVVNTGSGAARGGWFDRAYLSADNTLDADDRLLWSISRSRDLRSGEARHGLREFVLEAAEVNRAGFWSWRIIEVADQGGEVDEAGFEADNLRVSPWWVRAVGVQALGGYVPLGEPDAEPVETVAFISRESFDKLVARKATTAQPALQSEADPDRLADLNTDPSAAAPARPAAPPSPAALAPAAMAQSEPDRLPLRADASDDPNAAPIRPPGPRGAAEPARVSAAAAPAAVSGAPAPDAPLRDRDRSTSAPRDVREVIATEVRADEVEWEQDGEVLVGRGLRLIPVRPRPADFPATIYLNRPGSPTFDLYFDDAGRVSNVRITRGMGSRELDESLTNVLYRWRIEGPAVVEPGELVLRDFKLIFLGPR